MLPNGTLWPSLLSLDHTRGKSPWKKHFGDKNIHIASQLSHIGLWDNWCILLKSLFPGVICLSRDPAGCKNLCPRQTQILITFQLCTYMQPRCCGASVKELWKRDCCWWESLCRVYECFCVCFDSFIYNYVVARWRKRKMIAWYMYTDRKKFVYSLRCSNYSTVLYGIVHRGVAN